MAVAYVDGDASDGYDALTLQCGIVRIVDIAIDRLGGGDLRQRFEYGASADIAGVENQLDAGERLLDSRPHQTVRVGDETDHPGVIATSAGARHSL